MENTICDHRPVYLFFSFFIPICFDMNAEGFLLFSIELYSKIKIARIFRKTEQMRHDLNGDYMDIF